MIESYIKNLDILDYTILTFGAVLVFVQFVFILALWYHKKFATQNGSFCRDLFAGMCEFFPLMGLLGTVLGLLYTFESMDGGIDEVQTIIRKFAPALTTTISGILCMVVNLVVNMIYSFLLQKEVKDKEVVLKDVEGV